MASTDTRIAYGATCCWWGPIASVGKHSSGLPCCPVCHGMLLEMENEDRFIQAAKEYEENGHPRYVAFITWMKGKCFRTMGQAEAAFQLEHPT